MQLRRQITVGRWPRSLALAPNGRLAVACSGSGGVSVVDTLSGTLAFEENFVGINLGQLALSPDHTEVFFPGSPTVRTRSPRITFNKAGLSPAASGVWRWKRSNAAKRSPSTRAARPLATQRAWAAHQRRRMDGRLGRRHARALGVQDPGPRLSRLRRPRRSH